MYAAPLEPDYRSSTPAVSRGTSTSGDLFAKLLRGHAETSKPAPQPEEEAARPAARPQRDRATAEEADTTRRSDADDRDLAAGKADASEAADARDALDDRDAAATSPIDDNPDAAAAAGDEPTDTDADAVAVIALPVALAPTILLAAIQTAPATTAPAPAASAAPAIGAPTPTDTDGANVDAESLLPAKPAPLADPAAMPRPATGTPTPPAEILAQNPTEGLSPRNAAAQTAGTATTDTQPATSQATTTADPFADAAEGDVRIQVTRAADAAQTQGLTQGLGKLGTGAEVALAAQASGDPQRRPAADAGKPEIAAKPQPIAGIAGDAANPSTPATAPATTAAPGTATALQQRMAQSSGAFEAALVAATAEDTDGTGLPGTTTDTGLRTAGTPAGATAASLRAAAPHASPAEQIAVQVQHAVRDGASRITISLRPAELGQVEVRLEFAQDGRVSATITADRAETLDMLQRDSRALERSLQDAGLKTDSGSLSFDLRDGGRNSSWSQQMANGNREGTPMPARGERQATADAASVQPTMTSTADGGIDIHV